MTPNELSERCVIWSAKDPDSHAFAQIVTAASEVLGTYQRDLANEFEVAESTVSRWSKGIARPHPRIQRQIVQSILRRAKRLCVRTASGSYVSVEASHGIAAKTR
jgi:hypothetical protein